MQNLGQPLQPNTWYMSWILDVLLQPNSYVQHLVVITGSLFNTTNVVQPANPSFMLQK